jgi:hypothetical protein
MVTMVLHNERVRLRKLDVHQLQARLAGGSFHPQFRRFYEGS